MRFLVKKKKKKDAIPSCMYFSLRTSGEEGVLEAISLSSLSHLGYK